MKKFVKALIGEYVVLSLMYFLLDGVFRLLIFPVAFATFPILLFYGKLNLKKTLYQYSNDVGKNINNQKKLESKQAKIRLLKGYDTNVKHLYESGKGLFTKLMRERKLRSYQIDELKSLINKSLGCYVNNYRNYKFKNDAHEIYVKMKDFNLNAEDWDNIICYLKDIEQNPVPLINESNKTIKKVKKTTNKLKLE